MPLQFPTAMDGCITARGGSDEVSQARSSLGCMRSIRLQAVQARVELPRRAQHPASTPRSRLKRAKATVRSVKGTTISGT
jgi:hypothetical protein